MLLSKKKQINNITFFVTRWDVFHLVHTHSNISEDLGHMIPLFIVLEELSVIQSNKETVLCD